MSPTAPTRTRTRTVALAVAGVALTPLTVLGLTGCSSPSTREDAGPVTYLLETDAPVGTPLGTVTVDGSRGAGDAFAPQEFTDQRTTLPVQSASGWTTRMTVPAGSRPRVRATPPAGVLVRCHILLENGREIATATAPAAGEPVDCVAGAGAGAGAGAADG